MHFYKKTWEEKAFDLADQGISLDVLEQFKASAFSWAAAAELATQHLQDKDIYYWIMSGYGRALLKCNRYDEAIEFSKLAYEWELKQKQPLSALTIAEALIEQGKKSAAKPFLQASYTLIGEKIYDQFPKLERKTLKRLLKSDNCMN